MKMIEVVLNVRLERRSWSTIMKMIPSAIFKKLVAAQTGTRPEKFRIQKWYNIYKDQNTLADYEIHRWNGP
ncbi:unnamed protein product [Calypogeia fissa]